MTTTAAEVLTAHDAVLLNASIRSVNSEDIALTYAPEHRLSVVLYLSQHTDRAGVDDMADLTGTMIDLVLAHGGTFYLPYQQHYTPAQLRRGYPQIGEFFALKRRYDPAELLVNNLSARYANQPPSEAPSLTPLPRDAGSRAPASTDNCSTGALPCHVSSASPGDVRRRGRTAQAPERAT